MISASLSVGFLSSSFANTQIELLEASKKGDTKAVRDFLAKGVYVVLQIFVVYLL